jgi:hypothetical protein
MALIFSTNTESLVIGGKTFYIKEALKALGASWNAKMKQWELPCALDSTELRNQLLKKTQENIQEERANKKAEDKAKKIWEASPEGKAARVAQEKTFLLECLKKKKTNGAFHWICCENCVVLDWARQHTSCQACGHDNGMWKETFFVRGRLRTGD